MLSTEINSMAFAHSHKGVHKIQELQNPLEANSLTFQRENWSSEWWSDLSHQLEAGQRHRSVPKQGFLLHLRYWSVAALRLSGDCLHSSLILLSPPNTGHVSCFHMTSPNEWFLNLYFLRINLWKNSKLYNKQFN